ncbi:4-hydroxybenzoyl-CoA reductase subunit gamma [Bordetella flabilis]|uniref:4-hydroxybenzoyl-CoA reductase subunit gamma n=1 Tax=Bordetella flabilis TaxID=463014 RepID=A0A193GMK8_9BORD|nr:4-hydroxybenzoyl-CoA reductase subunit gamma [Bordetella flabilis]
MSVDLVVNRKTATMEVEPHASLADALRELAGTTSVHLGCEHGVCGACNVIVDGEVVRACLTLAAACGGCAVTTAEGLDDALADRLRDALHRHHGLQCGFCTPGMLITAHDMVSRGQSPCPASIREHLCGNICRCTGYQGIVAAIQTTIEEST